MEETHTYRDRERKRRREMYGEEGKERKWREGNKIFTDAETIQNI